MVKDNPKTMTHDEMKAREIVDKLPQCLNGKDWRGEDLVFQKNEVAIEKAAHIIGQALHSERQKQRERDAEKVLEGVNQHNPNSMIAQYLRGKAQAILSQEDL